MKNAGPVFAALLLTMCAAAFAQPPVLVVDGDNDGVSDEIDDCPYTPPNTPVDAHGCPVASDQDGDGVPDSMDDCPYTPKGAQVDAHGCAIDSDLDGVPDGIDLCPHSKYGERVDANGCEPGVSAGRASPAAPPASSRNKPGKSSSRIPNAAPSVVVPPAVETRAPARAVPIEPAHPTPEPVVPPVAEESSAASVPESQAPEPVPVVPVVPEPTAPTAPTAPTRVPSPPVVTVPRAHAPIIPAPIVIVPPSTVPASAISSASSADKGPLVVETLGSVRFRRNSAELSEIELMHLQRLVDAVKPRIAQLSGSGFYITGYLQTGEKEGVDMLRAELVRSYLVSRGLPPAQVRFAETTHAPRKDASGLTVLLQLIPLPPAE